MPPLQSLLHAVFVSAACLTLISASLTEHPINECFDSEFSTFNASASVHFPPLSPNTTNSSLATWKLNTAVKEIFQPSDKTSIVKQKWWLEGDANLPGNASASPIDGCIILLQATPNSSFTGQGPDTTTAQNGCSRVLAPACQNAMVDWVTRNITSFAGAELDNHWTVCPKIAHLLWEPPSECKADYHLDSIPLQPFGNPEFIAPSENGCNSSDFDIFEGSAIRNSFFELPFPPTPLGDHKTYDAVVGTTNPFLLVSWPKSRNQGWLPDAQIACLTPSEDIVTGSRIPGTSSKAGSKGEKNTASAAPHRESLFALWMLLMVVSLIL